MKDRTKYGITHLSFLEHAHDLESSNGGGLTDAKIQLISGHGNRYQHLSLAAIEGDYQKAVHNLEFRQFLQQSPLNNQKDHSKREELLTAV